MLQMKETYSFTTTLKKCCIWFLAGGLAAILAGLQSLPQTWEIALITGFIAAIGNIFKNIEISN